MAREERRGRPRGRRTRLAAAAVATALLTALGGGWRAGRASAATGVTRYSVLVIGDSILAQAAPATEYWAPKGSSVWVFGGPGSAPCDWNAGYRDPFSGAWFHLSELVDRYHPAAVVLSFSGNPGFSGPRAGCVNNATAYSLSSLLASYQPAVVAMARYAANHGARVYIDASPPRNPRTPPGAYRGPGGSRNYGFNGVARIDQLYSAIASSPEGVRDGWTYDTAAAAAVSDAALAWHLTEPCDLWDGSACQSDDEAQVRAGGRDSVHLDPHEAGATRYGQAILRAPLEDQGYIG